MAIKRTRNYVSIGYPESLKDGWRTILSEACVPCIVSPLHDKDINPDGEPKKAHYHIMVMYDQPKTPEQAQEFFDSIGAVKCQMVKNTRSQARYFCHLDNPEKHQYKILDVTQYAGADYQTIIDLPSDKFAVIAEMMDFCDSYDIHSFAELARYSRDNQEQWFRCLCSNGAMFMKEYLKSLTWERKN